MPANAIDWPAAVFPSRALFHPENQSRSGGASLTGSEQVTVSNSGRWRANLTLPVLTEESVLAWRAFVSLMEGRAGTCLVPKWERYGVRNMNGREFDQQPVAEYGEDTLNFDLSGFAQSEFNHAQLHVPAAAGATQLRLIINDGDGPRPGQYIGIGQRLYMVQSAWQETETGPLRVQIWPRLRASAVMAERVILDRPVCLMRFATDQTGELELDMGRWGTAGLELVEAI